MNAFLRPLEPATGVQSNLSPAAINVVPGTTATQVEPFHFCRDPVVTDSTRKVIASPSTSVTSEAVASPAYVISKGSLPVAPEMMAIDVNVGVSLTGFTLTTACTGVADSRPPSSRATALKADWGPLAFASGVQ